jgi:PAS domain S-box-containing protein
VNGVEQLYVDGISRRILESSGDCVKILDLAGRVVYVNPAGIQLMELCGPGDMLGRVWVDVWPDRDRETAREAVARALAGGRATFEGFCRTATGTPRWWDVSATPITDDGGAVIQLLVVSRDITGRRKEEMFRAGQHQVLEMIATCASLEDVLGSLVQLVERQCEGMLCSILLLDDDGVHMRHGAAPSLPAAFRRATDGQPIGARNGSCGAAMSLGRPIIVTDTLADPSWEDYRGLAEAHGLRACWSSPILGVHGKVLGSFAMYYGASRGPTHEEQRLIDIAADIARNAIEHHRAQEALRQSEARNRAILRAIPDWMFLLSVDGVFLEYHARDPEKLLVPPSAFLGRTVREVMPPALAEVLHGALARALVSDEAEEIEYSVGTEHDQRFYQACVVRCDGDRILSIVRDITDRKRAEMDVAEQRRELTHLSRVAMLGELSGALAHELSQPLTAILSNAQAARRFLDAGAVDVPELRPTLDDIIRNDRRAASVIERLRALLKKGDSVLQPLNMNEVVRDVLDLVQSDLLVRRVSVVMELSSSIPTVLGDRVQLQQVILNLVLNACDAMADTEAPDRQLTLATSADGEFVQLAVSDRGVGIPDHQLDAVFDPFVTFREQGLGLGLAISRSIVVAHHGRIVAENNPDRGATFRCFLPLARS